jgi:hypothetical protein
MNLDLDLARPDGPNGATVPVSNDELRIVTVLHCTPPPTTAVSPLSSQIGLCTRLTDLHINMCSRIPQEISNCQSLQYLVLNNCIDKIDLPQDIAFRTFLSWLQTDLPQEMVFNRLVRVSISYGEWNKEMIRKFLSWLASCAPNLMIFVVCNQSREVAKLFIKELSQNGLFIDKFKNILRRISFVNCYLIEEDLRSILFDMRPLYTRLYLINLRGNNVQGLQSVEMVVKKLKMSGPVSSSLIYLLLDDNPVLENLKSSESPDHDAVVCLLKAFRKLSNLRLNDDPSSTTYSSTIKYCMMVNKRGRDLYINYYLKAAASLLSVLKRQERQRPTRQGRRDLERPNVLTLIEQHPNPLNVMPVVLEHAAQVKKWKEDKIFNLLQSWFPNYLSSLSDEEKSKAKLLSLNQENKRLKEENQRKDECISGMLIIFILYLLYVVFCFMSKDMDGGTCTSE